MAFIPSMVHPDWDKNETRGMFAYMKPREIESLQYDKKVAFWSQCIAKYCELSKSCVINFAELRQKFRRGDLIPTPLENVMIEMYRKGDLQTEEDILNKNQGWLSWTLSFVKPKDPDVKTQQLIHRPTIAKLAVQLRNYQHELAEEDDETPEIISYNELRNKTQHIIKDPLSFEYAVYHLVKCGDILEGRSKSGERVLKFKDQQSRSPGRFTEADASVHDIRIAMRKIEGEIKRLESKEKTLKESAKQAIRDKNRTMAANILRKKKRVEKDLESKDGQYRQLLDMLGKIAETRQTKEVLDAYRIGNQAFKDALNRQGLSVDTIDKTIDDMHETMDDFKDINDAISTGFIPADQKIDEAELEDELNELMEADSIAERNNTVKINKDIINISDLPPVPSSGLPSTSTASPLVNLSDSLEVRMKRLREQA